MRTVAGLLGIGRTELIVIAGVVTVILLARFFIEIGRRTR